MRIMVLMLVALAICASALAAQMETPPDLAAVEREVSLKIAHARGAGFTDPPKMKKLADAEKFDREGEAALKSGDFNTAEDDFLKAKLLLHDLGM